MTDISEEMLVAYADGELDEVNRRRVDRALALDPTLMARLDAHQRLRTTLADHYAVHATETVPARFTALLESGGDVVPIGQAAGNGRKRAIWPGWATVSAIAASLIIGLGLGRTLHSGNAPVGVEDGQLVAQGALAQALETQLASAPQAGEAVHIGVTFRARDGQWCRSFDGAALSGVACRIGRQWRMEQTLPGSGGQRSAYRQAASQDARTTATVDALIAGSALDAAQEKAMRDAGWQSVR